MGNGPLRTHDGIRRTLGPSHPIPSSGPNVTNCNIQFLVPLSGRGRWVGETWVGVIASVHDVDRVRPLSPSRLTTALARPTASWLESFTISIGTSLGSSFLGPSDEASELQVTT